MENNKNHYLVIGKNTKHLIWEGQENNDIVNYDIGIDILLLINFKNEYENFTVPDNFLYADFETDEPVENEYQLLNWNMVKMEYVVICDTTNILKSKSKSVEKKMSEINQHIHKEYLDLIDFSKKIIHEINDSNSIKKLYEISNNVKNPYSKMAKFLLAEINNKETSNEKLINDYGSIKKTINMMGMFLTSLQKETGNFQLKSQEKLIKWKMIF